MMLMRRILGRLFGHRHDGVPPAKLPPIELPRIDLPPRQSRPSDGVPHGTGTNRNEREHLDQRRRDHEVRLAQLRMVARAKVGKHDS